MAGNSMRYLYKFLYIYCDMINMEISEFPRRIYYRVRGFMGNHNLSQEVAGSSGVLDGLSSQDSTKSKECRESILFSENYKLWNGIGLTLLRMGEPKLKDDLFYLRNILEGEPSETIQIPSEFREKIEGRLKSLESFCDDYNKITSISSDIESGGYYNFSCECSPSYLGINLGRIKPVSDRLNELERNFFIYTSLSEDRSYRQTAVEICQSRFLVPLRKEIITKIEEMKNYSV